MSYEIEDSTELSAEKRRSSEEKSGKMWNGWNIFSRLFTQMSKLETGMIRLKPEKAGVKATLARAVAGAYAKAVDKTFPLKRKNLLTLRLSMIRDGRRRRSEMCWTTA